MYATLVWLGDNLRQRRRPGAECDRWFLLRIWDVPVSFLILQAGYPEFSRGLSQRLHANAKWATAGFFYILLSVVTKRH
jgi:hypothetical protein